MRWARLILPDAHVMHGCPPRLVVGSRRPTRLRQGARAVDVAVGMAHRIENTGREPLIFVEVQLGDSFDEGDIERLEDDYGRHQANTS
jgi:hypothetical protein